MKKKYSKPDIFFEAFSLSTNIAAGCEYSTNFAKDVCGYKFGAINIYIENITNCAKKVVDGDGAYNGICYHNPTEDKNIFDS